MNDWRKAQEPKYAHEDRQRQEQRGREDAEIARVREHEDAAISDRQDRELADLGQRHDSEHARRFDERRAANPAAHESYYQTGAH